MFDQCKSYYASYSLLILTWSSLCHGPIFNYIRNTDIVQRPTARWQNVAMCLKGKQGSLEGKGITLLEISMRLWLKHRSQRSHMRDHSAANNQLVAIYKLPTKAHLIDGSCSFTYELPKHKNQSNNSDFDHCNNIAIGLTNGRTPALRWRYPCGQKLFVYRVICVNAYCYALQSALIDVYSIQRCCFSVKLWLTVITFKWLSKVNGVRL